MGTVLWVSLMTSGWGSGSGLRTKLATASSLVETRSDTVNQRTHGVLQGLLNESLAEDVQVHNFACRQLRRAALEICDLDRHAKAARCHLVISQMGSIQPHGPSGVGPSGMELQY